MDRFLNRRLFLKLGGMSLALGVADPALARRLGTERRLPDHALGRGPRPRDQRSTPTLVTIFLRGGADGLNMLPPSESTQHDLYRGYRPTLGVDLAEMQAAGTLLTDSGLASVGWGLHPRMTSLMPVWDQGALAIFPDVHYDYGSRSHFDSQQFYDNGTPWKKFTPDGWANRHLSTSEGGSPLLRAVAFDSQTPFPLQGPYPALTFSNLSDLSVSGSVNRNERFLATQEEAYPTILTGPAINDREVAQAGADLVAAIRAIEALDLPAPSDTAAPIYPSNANGGVEGRHGYFGDRLIDLAKLIKSNAFNIEIAEIDLYGWDTHNLQITNLNNHPDLCEALARGMRAFYEDLGDYLENVVVVVMSEFGRTTRENGSAGTDHGSATAFFVMGHPSRVAGRAIYHGSAGFRGLDDLRDNRDLHHSTDFRSILSEVISRHLGNDSPEVFPDFTPEPIGVIL